MKEYLKHNKIICDGAFGTYYNALGFNGLPEWANFDSYETVKKIHMDYIRAGASLIRTNTFAANTRTMYADTKTIQPDKKILEDCLKAGYEIAKAAVKESANPNVFIAADMGPLEEEQGYSEEEALNEYQFLTDVFLNAGTKVLLFETLSGFGKLPELLIQIKEKHPDVFIMVQFALNQHGYTEKGISCRKLLESAMDLPQLDLIGFNCGVGPGHLLKILREVPLPKNLYISALPNAGYPNSTAGRMVFMENREYFGQKMLEIASLGINILGGCCGTDPEYIKITKSYLDQTNFIKTDPYSEMNEINRKQTSDNRFYKSKGNAKVIAVELSPPINANSENIMDAANILRKCNVDVVTFPDSPSGRTRADSVLMAIKVLRETGLCVMPHICCRDKNAIAIRAQILGAHINGVKNFLVITGDPVPVNVRNDIKSVFNFDSTGMMKIMQQMNQEQFANDQLVFGGAINHTRRNLEVEIARVKKKMECGATFFMTQPVFCEKDIESLKQIKKETKAYILCGIMPLVSRKNAIFMKNEMTGIEVPDDLIERYLPDMNKYDGEEVGVNIAKEIISKTQDFVDGYYFSLPFNRTYLLNRIL